MRNTLYMLVVSCLFGCTNAKNETIATDNLSDNSAKVATSPAQDVVLNPLQKVAPVPKGVNSSTEKNKLYRYQFNGRQFTTSTEQLVKGTVVYDTQMSVFGKLKGSLVLVSQLPLSTFSPGFSIDNIAENTYRLIPLDSRILLLDVLKHLQEFGQAELEVDYSPMDRTPIIQRVLGISTDNKKAANCGFFNFG